MLNKALSKGEDIKQTTNIKQMRILSKATNDIKQSC